MTVPVSSSVTTPRERSQRCRTSSTRRRRRARRSSRGRRRTDPERALERASEVARAHAARRSSSGCRAAAGTYTCGHRWWASGSDVARSGTSVPPSRPPTRLNPTRPSPVIGEHRPGRGRVADSLVERVGAVTSNRRRVPPRWTVAVSRALSQTRPPIDARLCGPLPTAIVRTMSPASRGRCGRSGRRSCRQPRSHRRSRAPTTGPARPDHGVTDVGVRIDAGDGSVEAVRDPDRAVPDRDRLGPVADMERPGVRRCAGSRRVTVDDDSFAIQSAPRP